jgi:hypothetical protein
MAMLHPALPLELHGWQDALALFAVWAVAFRVQNLRYARFHARWHGKIVAHQLAEFRSGPGGGSWLSHG